MASLEAVRCYLFFISPQVTSYSNRASIGDGPAAKNSIRFDPIFSATGSAKNLPETDPSRRLFPHSSSCATVQRQLSYIGSLSNNRFSASSRVSRGPSPSPRAGFKGGGANWAVAQGPPQLTSLHKNIDILSYYYNCKCK